MNWWTIRAAICRRPDGHCLVHGGTAIEGGSHRSRGLEEIPTYEHVKYKIQASAGIVGLLKMFVKDLCAVCLAETDRSAIFCGGCLHG